MKPTNEEVYNALITLQNLCYETTGCSKCPLYAESIDRCWLLNETPNEWTIKGVSKWKAFE